MQKPKIKSSSAKNKFTQFFKRLGPGLVTGASDDDPSGIATYSQAGAQFGGKLLWTAIVTYPLMVNTQEMCARIGLVTGSGLAKVIKTWYPKSILYFIVFLCFTSITLNIGADIAGMGAVGNLLYPKIPAFVYSVIFTGILTYAIVFWKYNRIVSVLKWLCISLFAYIVIPFITKTNWSNALVETFLPKIEFSKDYFLMLVGILGTTISPYLFFWQATMEAEELDHKRIVVDKKVISAMETDVRGGMLLTNVVFYFIILATGTVLFQGGIHNITSVEQAAMALRPLAGEYSYILFAVGVLGTGALAIPVLAGSLGYMMSETFGWKSGLDKTFTQAKGFYITMIISLAVGLVIHFTGITPMKALLWAAVMYGIVAPFLIALILHICNRKAIMGKYANSTGANIVGFITLLLMSTAAIAFIYLLLF